MVESKTSPNKLVLAPHWHSKVLDEHGRCSNRNLFQKQTRETCDCNNVKPQLL